MKFSTILFFVGLIFIFVGIAFGLNLLSDERDILPVVISTQSTTPTPMVENQNQEPEPQSETEEAEDTIARADNNSGNPDLTGTLLPAPTSPAVGGGVSSGDAGATATPAAMQPVAVPNPGQNNEILGLHVVQPLEGFNCIGKAYGVSPSAIAAENGYFITDMLPVGVTLRIPNVPFMANAGIKTCFPQFVVTVVFPTPTSTPLPTITSTPEPEESQIIATQEWGIEVEVPQNMFLGESLYVELLYYPITDSIDIEMFKSEFNDNDKVNSINTEGRYGKPIQDSFGVVKFYDDQLLYATAGLEGAGFEIAPSGDMRQAVTRENEEVLKWLWSIKPTEIENQTLVISLDLDYEPIAPSMNKVESPPTWSKPLIISVRSTHMGLRQRDLETFTVLSTLIGLLLSGYKVLEVLGLVSKPSEE